MRGRLVLEKRHMTQAVCMERSPRIEFINKTRNEIWCFLRQSRAMKSQSLTSGSRGRTRGTGPSPWHATPPPTSAPSSAPTTQDSVSRMDVLTRQGIESMQTYGSTHGWSSIALQPGHQPFPPSTTTPIRALISGLSFGERMPLTPFLSHIKSKTARGVNMKAEVFTIILSCWGGSWYSFTWPQLY